jgi:hypothetical protein
MDPEVQTIPDAQRLELARKALREFHTQCFWFMREDAELSLDDIPEIARGLRLNGGRQGFLLAARLCP